MKGFPMSETTKRPRGRPRNDGRPPGSAAGTPPVQVETRTQTVTIDIPIGMAVQPGTYSGVHVDFSTRTYASHGRVLRRVRDGLDEVGARLKPKPTERDNTGRRVNSYNDVIRWLCDQILEAIENGEEKDNEK